MQLLQFFVNPDKDFENRPQDAHSDNGGNRDNEKH